MSDPKPMTEEQVGHLLILSIVAFAVMSLARTFVPLRYDYAILILAVGFIIAIYRAIPDDRGTLDFKSGLITGGTLGILVYEMIRVGMPMLFDLMVP